MENILLTFALSWVLFGAVFFMDLVGWIDNLFLKASTALFALIAAFAMPFIIYERMIVEGLFVYKELNDTLFMLLMIVYVVSINYKRVKIERA